MATSWDDRFMSMAEFIAQWSKDRSRKVGACIVDGRNTVVSMGWNGMPRGVDDDVEARHARPAKYLFAAHAEANAIFNAAAIGVPTLGCTIYVTLFPCDKCAQAIIQSGIKKVVCCAPADWNDATYKDSWEASMEMFDEAKVETVWYGEDEVVHSFEEADRRIAEFKVEVDAYLVNNPHQRYGQACFNTLAILHPGLAETIRGEGEDPYYAPNPSRKLWAFWEFLKDEWA